MTLLWGAFSRRYRGDVAHAARAVMLIPASVALIALQAIPTPLAPADRNLSALLQSAEGAQFFLGNWGWFALVVLMLVFNTVIGEERRSCSGS